jgi:hypothetical protein
MELHEIGAYVSNLNPVPLTMENIDSFRETIKRFFGEGRVKVCVFFRMGKNCVSDKKHDFSKGKPSWKGPHVAFSERVEFNERPEKNVKWVTVFFEGDHWIEVWGVLNESSGRRLPLLISVDEEKRVVYVAEQSGNGTPDFPYENLYVIES